jgi:hypothetical protein
MSVSDRPIAANGIPIMTPLLTSANVFWSNSSCGFLRSCGGPAQGRHKNSSKAVACCCEPIGPPWLPGVYRQSGALV